MRRKPFTREEARSCVEELEQARIAFFRKFFKVHPYEISLYHMVINTGEMGVDTAAKAIVHAVAAGLLTSAEPNCLHLPAQKATGPMQGPVVSRRVCSIQSTG